MIDVAFIPARGGSKRVPGKNLKPIGGYSLVERAIKSAWAAGLCPVVSTDDREIAHQANRFGASIHWRPDRLASDHAQIEHALGHWLNRCAPIPPPETVIAILQPTSPFRRPETIKACVEHVRSGRWEAACTVTERRDFRGRLKADEHGVAFLRYAPPSYRPRTQDAPARWSASENGCVYTFTRRHLKATGSRLSATRTAAVVISEHEAWDIDTPWDLAMAQLMADLTEWDMRGAA